MKGSPKNTKIGIKIFLMPWILMDMPKVGVWQDNYFMRAARRLYLQQSQILACYAKQQGNRSAIFKKETKTFSYVNGKYKLDILHPLPPEFNALYSGNSLHSEHFLKF